MARHCHRDGETTASHRASAAPDSAQPDMTTACGFGRAGGGGGRLLGGAGGRLASRSLTRPSATGFRLHTHG